jgi:hypothetical protein
MFRHVLPATLMTLSLSLTGCVAYELDNDGYSNSRYSAYGYQQPAYPVIRSSSYGYPAADARERYNQQQNSYPIVRYSQYPQQQTARYRTQRQPVYYYRQVPAGYWPASAWQGDQGQGGHSHGRLQHDHGREHERYGNQYPRPEQYERGRKQPRGWTFRIN